MKSQTYPRIKSSGVEWLGEVPEHWEVNRLRRIGEAIIGLTYSPIDVVNEGEGTLVLRSSNIQGGRIKLDDNVFVSTAIPTTLRTKKDDILICTRNGSRDLVGKTGKISERESGLTFGAFTAVFRSPANDYIFYVFNSGLFSFQAGLYQTSTIFQLTNGTINAFQIPLPPPAEQQSIAAFLDRETGRLDRLVAKKRELIERLKEKRTALISRTVTRGLPPAAARADGLPDNPPLKPSGADWLGEIPEHWDVKPVKSVARIGNGSTPSRDNPNYWEEGVYPWLNSSVVNQERITDAEEFVTTLALQECHLPKILPPAVLIGITGQGRTRGMASTLLFEATINQHVAYVKPYSSRAEVGFLRRVFDMVYPFLRSESDGGGSTKGAITCEQVANLKVPVPPLPEQAAIAAYLDLETAKLDALVGKVEEAVERLLEYRTALITAAVTGKIDVRNTGKLP
jgi:type I restriction enzyme S subunit